MPDGCIGNCLQCGRCATRFTILDEFSPGNDPFTPREGYGIAVDIGTTTVVLALLDLQNGQMTARHSFMNPQRRFGPDVISRIGAANEGNLPVLQRILADSIADGVRTLLAARDLPAQQVTCMTVAGNTTMIYLLLGFPCESLGAYPFQPAYTPNLSYPFAELFGEGGVNAAVHIVPFLAAFVGGDITAGLLHVRDGRRTLLIDLGTNGEMALLSGQRLLITSTAAGPAFEGSGHRGGASGVLDDLAALVRDGTIDETGLLESETTVFTQKAVRDLQLAKSAVRSGLEILLETAGLSYGELDAVVLAGGIGQAMNVQSAVDVGLLPKAVQDKVRAVGNASLGGAVKLLLAPALSQSEQTLTRIAEEINLSAHPKFNDYFMNYMFLGE